MEIKKEMRRKNLYIPHSSYKTIDELFEMTQILNTLHPT